MRCMQALIMVSVMTCAFALAAADESSQAKNKIFDELAETLCDDAQAELRSYLEGLPAWDKAASKKEFAEGTPTAAEAFPPEKLSEVRAEAEKIYRSPSEGEMLEVVTTTGRTRRGAFGGVVNTIKGTMLKIGSETLPLMAVASVSSGGVSYKKECLVPEERQKMVAKFVESNFYAQKKGASESYDRELSQFLGQSLASYEAALRDKAREFREELSQRYQPPCRTVADAIKRVAIIETDILTGTGCFVKFRGQLAVLTNFSLALGVKLKIKDTTGKAYEVSEIVFPKNRADAAMIILGPISPTQPVFETDAVPMLMKKDEVIMLGNNGAGVVAASEGRIIRVSQGEIKTDAKSATSGGGGPVLLKKTMQPVALAAGDNPCPRLDELGEFENIGAGKMCILRLWLDTLTKAYVVGSLIYQKGAKAKTDQELAASYKEYQDFAKTWAEPLKAVPSKDVLALCPPPVLERVEGMTGELQEISLRFLRLGAELAKGK